MEIGIPALALLGLYVASNQKCKTKESFANKEGLPNVDVPNTNFPQEYPVLNPVNDLTSKLSNHRLPIERKAEA